MLIVNLNDLISNNHHTSWEIGGGPEGVQLVMNEVRNDDNKLLHYWVEEVVDDNTTGFQDCVNFRQLSSGRWAGHTLWGTFVSLESYEKGEYPDRFKYEPSRRASMTEAQEYWDKEK